MVERTKKMSRTSVKPESLPISFETQTLSSFQNLYVCPSSSEGWTLLNVRFSSGHVPPSQKIPPLLPVPSLSPGGKNNKKKHARLVRLNAR